MLVTSKSANSNVDALVSCAKTNWRRPSAGSETAMCNNGDTVSIRELMKPKDWWLTRLGVHLRPQNWIAQRRFESALVDTPIGPRHVCIGIYTVNGKAAGAYARLSEKPVIDFAAMDVALLLQDHD